MARGTTKVSRWFGDESQSEASVPMFHNGRFLNRLAALPHVFISRPRTVALQLIHVKGHFTFSCIACLEAL